MFAFLPYTLGGHMLIEFSISGFKAFTDTQTLRLTKTKGAENPEMYFEENGISLLRTAAIYGTNGSGKSSILEALDLMRSLVLCSGNLNTDDILKKISESTRDTASMSIEFISTGVRYRYNFSVKDNRIISEMLQASPQGRTQRLFEREFDDITNTYKFSYFGKLQGEKKHWERATKANMLYLGTAIYNGSVQLEPIRTWFKELNIISSTSNAALTGEYCLKEKNAGILILNFIRALNIGVTELKIYGKAIGGPNDFEKNIPLDAMNITLIHQGPNGSTYELPLAAESEGTKRLIALAGPLVYAYYTGRVIFIDDLDLHLHQKVFNFIAELFNDTTSEHNGQLVFTAHNTSILSQQKFRRDEIWFCEKTPDNICSLRPLTDFKPRKDSDDIEQNYLTGKYDIVPYVISL